MNPMLHHSLALVHTIHKKDCIPHSCEYASPLSRPAAGRAAWSSDPCRLAFPGFHPKKTSPKVEEQGGGGTVSQICEACRALLKSCQASNSAVAWEIILRLSWHAPEPLNSHPFTNPARQPRKGFGSKFLLSTVVLLLRRLLQN